MYRRCYLKIFVQIPFTCLRNRKLNNLFSPLLVSLRMALRLSDCTVHGHQVIGMDLGPLGVKNGLHLLSGPKCHIFLQRWKTVQPSGWVSSVLNYPSPSPLFLANHDSLTFVPMPYCRDFSSFFNRIDVCRLFPPSWHQLTLHCGWQGPSAGGPYWHSNGGQGAIQITLKFRYLKMSNLWPIFFNIITFSLVFILLSFVSVFSSDVQSLKVPSSTWCCNPQFRISVRKPCEVLVCLGQQDPRIENRRHVCKKMRKRSIGMQVKRRVYCIHCRGIWHEEFLFRFLNFPSPFWVVSGRSRPMTSCKKHPSHWSVKHA